VGSAAFNLLCISAVCVMAIPDGETRKIDQVPVYVITATCSVAAYMWLMFVLMAPPSPNVCETWEAVLTLLFFPILVFFAYLADRGYCEFLGGSRKAEADSKQSVPMQGVIPENVTKDELAQIEQQIRQQHGTNITEAQVLNIMASKYFTQRSRAYYRHTAMQQTLGMKKVDSAATGAPECAVTPVLGTSDAADSEREQVLIGFESARYAFLENIGSAPLILTRSGLTNVKASVNYKTRDGTAVAGSDYETSEGTIVFERGETTKTLSIKITDDNAYEENEEFYVDLSQPIIAEESSTRTAILSPIPTVTVVIIDDDEPGLLRFQTETVEFEEGTEESVVNVIVERCNGASGIIGCSYHTDDMSAVAGMDYQEAVGKIELGQAVQSAIIPITIMPQGRYEKSSGFNVVITDPVNCKFDKETDGGEERCICHVTIKGSNSAEKLSLLKKMESRVNTNQAKLGHTHWKQQFYSAVFVVKEEDEDQEEGAEQVPPTCIDYFMHCLSLPWKLLFACVPPVDYCGGWACFSGALVMIAIVTAIVGDMANLVGCTMNINPEITAITFVALGTSLPDTFASKAAAEMDPYADASIGNITGSNSVNVFLGLGLSWSIAAFYWETQDAPQAWTDKVMKPGGAYYDIRDDVLSKMKGGRAVFVVPAGSLWFNLMVFSVNAICAIQHLLARRKKWGGELGGPLKGFMGQYFSASFLIGQWFIYIIASSVFATMRE